MHDKRCFAVLLLSASLGLLSIGGCELDATTASGSAYSALLDDAQGLAPGGRVYVAGVRVGRVTQVTLDNGKASVMFAIDDDAVVSIHDDACVGVSWHGFSDSAHLRLEPGATASPTLPAKSRIACTDAGHATSKRVDELSDKAGKVLEAALSGDGTIAKLLNDKALAAKVEAFFSQPPPPQPSDPSEPPPAPEPPPAQPKAPKAPPKPAEIIDPFGPR